MIQVLETTQSLTLVKRLLFGLGVYTLVLFAQKPKGVHGTAVDISHSSKKLLKKCTGRLHVFPSDKLFQHILFFQHFSHLYDRVRKLYVEMTSSAGN